MYMDFEIKEIATDEEFEDCVKVIRNSFITVAEEFNLTRQNAPTNPAYIDIEALLKMKENGVKMYGGYYESELIAFAVIEKANDDIYYLEKLCVIPTYRHHGYGEQLIKFVFNTVRSKGGKKVCIGIINDNAILKKWYMKNDFSETMRKTFSHLPFEVCSMEKLI